jgi:fused signal recognition particle receptor
MFGKLFAGLKKTRDLLAAGLSRLSRGRKLDETFLDDLEEVLYTSDLGPTGSEIVGSLKQAYRDKTVKTVEEVPAWLRTQLLARLEGCGGTLKRAASGPTVVLVVGVNGAGKTTSIAKLANLLAKKGNVMLGAGDTFRAGAVQQLTIWAQRIGIPIVTPDGGNDPAAVAYQAVAQAIARKVDWLILDTAGRLHTQKNLMEQLKKIFRVIQKQIPDAPHEVLLVLDATTGQNAIRQSEEFFAAAQVTGLILAKMDGTAKGGAVFGIRRSLPIPVKFVGVGEGIDDLEVFDPAEFVDAILKFETTAEATS